MLRSGSHRLQKALKRVTTRYSAQADAQFQYVLLQAIAGGRGNGSGP